MAWTEWTSSTCTTTNITYTATSDTWSAWTSGTTTTTSGTWTIWVNGDGGTGSNNSTWGYWCTGSGTVTVQAPVQETEESRRRREAAREAAQAREAAAQAEREAAHARARLLLMSMLSEAQRQQYEKDRFFEVIGQHTRRRYRIHHGTHGNVKLLDDQGREVVSYCGQPNGVPTEDAMLAQKLQIEYDENEYVRLSNATRLRAA